MTDDELSRLLDEYRDACVAYKENCDALSVATEARKWRDAARAALRAALEGREDAFDFREHLYRQREWSARTFGPGSRAAGVVDHIRKELGEIEADPADLTEWIDVVILALDGAWRSGATPEQIIAALRAKQAKNEARQWPDWRTMPADKAIEHTRSDAARTEGKWNG